MVGPGGIVPDEVGPGMGEAGYVAGEAGYVAGAAGYVAGAAGYVAGADGSGPPMGAEDQRRIDA